MTYRAQTQVPISKTKTDIQKLRAQHGAIGFAYPTKGNRSMVGFDMSGQQVQITLAMPSIDEILRTPPNTRRAAAVSRQRGNKPTLSAGGNCC